MSVFLILLIIIWILIFVYYVFNLYVLIKNVKPEYQNDKFKIFGLLLFISKTYFNEIGIKYLTQVRYLAFILLVFWLIIMIKCFQN